MNRIWWPVIVGIVVVGVAAFGQRESPREPKSAADVWRVTPWPVEDPEKDDAREVEEHLNRLAAEGWRFHGQLSGHRSSMLVFERARSDRDREPTESPAEDGR